MLRSLRLRWTFTAGVLALITGLASLTGCQDSNDLGQATAQYLQTESPIQVYFTRRELPHKDPRHPARVLAHYIQQAQKTLDVCAHELDSSIITEALLEAHKRGVRVRVVTESAYIQESSIRALQDAGVPVVGDERDGALMHNKFIVFDNQAVWTGSMNFTDNCTSRNDNHALYISDERLAANYATKFRWMFEQRQFGNPPTKEARIPYPQVKLADGTVIENYFAPHDRVAEKLIARIRQAQASIHFLVFSFTHRGIAEAMMERARQGIEVLGVLERRQAIAVHSVYATLASFGPPVQVYLDANKYNMHHKLLILDGKISVAGSFNWSVSADKDNDENVLIIHSRAIAEQFEAEFQRILAQARAAGQ